jgi:2,4-dichlorophenol 6-monooxygenase
MEFNAHDVEIGFSYDNGALVPDGTPRPPRDPEGRKYQPTTRPGHRLPHAWLERDGRQLSTQDLVKASGGFALLTDATGAAWEQAAATVSADLGVPITVGVIGHDQLVDSEGTWPGLSGVQAGGAVLARPDHFVAWRVQALPDDPASALADAVRGVLSYTGN